MLITCNWPVRNVLLALSVGLYLLGIMACEGRLPAMSLLLTDWTKSYALYGQPHAIWLDGDDRVGANEEILNHTLIEAAQREQYPELVIYSIPRRDLGQSSEGGFANFEMYWQDNQRNAAILKRFVAKTHLLPRVYLEPDALAHAVQFRADHQNNAESLAVYHQRVDMLPRLIRLYQDAGAKVYLDAAHSDWFDYADENIQRIATALKDAHIDWADGLMTNVSNRQKLDTGERNEYHYLGRLLPLLNNPKLDVIVDTSRNGGVTHPRQYYLSPGGDLIDNDTSQGRWVGTWQQDASGLIHIQGALGLPKTLDQLLSKEKYTYHDAEQILVAPPWLDPVGKITPGPAPTDTPPTTMMSRIHRLRWIKPPDDCDGSLNCPPGASRSEIDQQTATVQFGKIVDTVKWLKF